MTTAAPRTESTRRKAPPKAKAKPRKGGRPTTRPAPVPKNDAGPPGAAGLGARVRAGRADRSLTIRALSKAAGVSIGAISEIENDNVENPSIDLAERLAAGLGLSLGDLLGISGAEAGAAMNGTAPAPAGTDADRDTVMIPLDRLCPDPENYRKTFEPEGLKAMAHSISQDGLLQNLVVTRIKPKKKGAPDHMLVAGERRWRALKALAKDGRLASAPGLESGAVLCRIVTGDPAQLRAMSIIENLQREDVNPMEEAEAFAALMALEPAAGQKKWDGVMIANRIKKTPEYVQQRARLVERLEPAIKDKLRAGEISFTYARELTLAGAKTRKKLVGQIEAGRIGSVDELKRAVSDSHVPVSRAIFDVKKCSLETIKKGGGKLYFLDKAAFEKAQRAAAKAKAETLAKTWAWAEFEEGHYFSSWQYGGSKDKKKAGAIVFFKAWDGTVEIHTGLVKKKAGRGVSKAEEARAKKEAETRAALDEKVATFRAQMRAALALDAKAAVALMLAESLGLPTGLDMQCIDEGPAGELTAALTGALGDAVEPVNRRTYDMTLAEPRGGDPAVAWAALGGLGEGSLTGLLARRIAAAFDLPRWQDAGPAVRAIAAKHKIEVPEDIWPVSDDEAAAEKAIAEAAERAAADEADDEAANANASEKAAAK